MLDLLDRIRDAVGTMHFHVRAVSSTVSSSYLRLKSRIGKREALDDAELRGLFKVEVAGVIPAAHVHPGNVIAALVFSVGGGGLIPAVKLLSDDGRETTVIQMRSAVPHAVGFANGNVVHLFGDVVVQAVLPDVGVGVFADREGLRYAGRRTR